MSDVDVYFGMEEMKSQQTSSEQDESMQVLGKHDYTVTNTGRLTIPDFGLLTGAESGQKFILIGPKGRTKTWRILAAPEDQEEE